jgi:hypothetical protein
VLKLSDIGYATSNVKVMVGVELRHAEGVTVAILKALSRRTEDKCQKPQPVFG